MNDKIVTHEDREALTYLNLAARGADLTPDERQLVDGLLARLGAAAEADQPPLPEGWVPIEPHEVREGDIVSVYYQGRDDHEGGHYTGRVTESEGLFSITDAHRDFLAVYIKRLDRSPDGVTDYRRLTPLRPTFTEADVERAARAARSAWFGVADNGDVALQDAQDVWKKTVRAALDTLDIENGETA